MLAGTNEVQKAVADGDVAVDVHEAQGERSARGDLAVYTAATGEVALTGKEGVEIAFTDRHIQGIGRGAKAIYAGQSDVLEMSGSPVMSTPYGQVWADVLVLDHARTALKATGNWKMKLKPETLPKSGQPVSRPRPSDQAGQKATDS